MKKAMTAAAALVLGVALAASAQATGTMRHSAMPSQQTAQSGTTAAPQMSKQRTTRKLAKRVTARRHVVAKHSSKRVLASLKRHKTSTKMARLHRRAPKGQQPSTAIGSSTMPNNNQNLNNIPSPTDQTTAGSGSSTMPQDQSTPTTTK